MSLAADHFVSEQADAVLARLERVRKLGVREDTVWRVMHAAGPGLALETIEWTLSAIRTLIGRIELRGCAPTRYGPEWAREWTAKAAHSALNLVLAGAAPTGITSKDFDLDRVTEAFIALGITPPNKDAEDVLRILKGAKIVLRDMRLTTPDAATIEACRREVESEDMACRKDRLYDAACYIETMANEKLATLYRGKQVRRSKTCLACRPRRSRPPSQEGEGTRCGRSARGRAVNVVQLQRIHIGRFRVPIVDETTILPANAPVAAAVLSIFEHLLDSFNNRTVTSRQPETVTTEWLVVDPSTSPLNNPTWSELTWRMHITPHGLKQEYIRLPSRRVLKYTPDSVLLLGTARPRDAFTSTVWGALRNHEVATTDPALHYLSALYSWLLNTKVVRRGELGTGIDRIAAASMSAWLGPGMLVIEAADAGVPESQWDRAIHLLTGTRERRILITVDNPAFARRLESHLRSLTTCQPVVP
ncbi:MAG: hypothetical protein KatS3mg082_1435 [Nitrospiraceae bacterium]|nr:MAG: hypothetical protein KatS3mg082_1435 [Nitrospiraceae bacterium]